MLILAHCHFFLQKWRHSGSRALGLKQWTINEDSWGKGQRWVLVNQLSVSILQLDRDCIWILSGLCTQPCDLWEVQLKSNFLFYVLYWQEDVLDKNVTLWVPQWLVHFAVVAVVVGCYALKALSLKVGDLRWMVVICGVEMVCIPSVLL